jgi:hypothetical protein
MTSGIPLSDNEREYIDTHLNDGPGRIAFELGRLFRQDNGGFRSSRTVRMYIYRKRREMEEGCRLTFQVPSWILMAAIRKGLTRQDLVSTAEMAIRERVAQN